MAGEPPTKRCSAWSQSARYPTLATFLRHSVEEITHEVEDLFNCCLAQSYSRAGRELDEFRLSVAKATNEKLLLFREIGRVVLDPNVSDGQLRRIIYQYVPADKLLAAVEECERLVRPLDDSYFHFLARRYGQIREFAPAFLCRFDNVLPHHPSLRIEDASVRWTAQGR